MEFNYFDVVASVIILLLGLKGIINGFFKELFGLVGIIGGLFVASRVGDKVGQYLSDMVFNFQSEASISFTGFLATLAVFWLGMVLVGLVFKKLSSLSGLGLMDRIFGFVFGAGKFFLITAVISFAIYNVSSLRSTIDPFMKTSIMFPIFVKTGGFIMKMDPTSISQNIDSAISQKAQDIQDKVEENIAEATKEQIEDIKQQLHGN